MSLRVFDSVRDNVSQLMSAREEVLAAYIFGSVATGRLRPNSDIDIAVLVDTRLVSGDLFKYP
jgi:predicted nucleotidyltransferase